MKTNRSLMNGLVACGLVLAMTSALSAQTAIQSPAKVVRIRGHARYSAGAMGWRPLSVGDLIKPGATIQTSDEKGAYVDLVLYGGEASLATGPSPLMMTPADYNPATPPTFLGYHPSAVQNVVRVFANTALGVDKLSSTDTGAGAVTETQLDLKAGHIFASVKKMSAGSKYEVKIPNGVAGIRGTTMELFSEGVIKVGEGAALLAYVNGSGQVTTENVPGGMQFDARTGVLAPLPTIEESYLKDLGRDAAFFAAFGANAIISPDFTVSRPVSQNTP
jgi:hypothetical protein